MKLENNYEVVISGVGGLFPKCDNLEIFKEKLLNNENLMGSRWKAGERGLSNLFGVISNTESFDASYFGIHREQCKFMDPMQRMVLERCYEALIDAGVNPVDIKGRRVGVYTGATVGENDNIFYESIVSGFGVTGHSRSMTSNRVSYWLNLKGPSTAYDSNWISGIEVLQTAYEVVKTGQCEAALVATTNLALNAEISWLYSDIELLSPDGTTKAFDADANGYTRSDGVIALYIQRACDAKRSYATILAIDSRFNGDCHETLIAVNKDNMSNFIQNFYDDCKVDPRDVEFVECYGCGLKKVDEVELNALDSVYCKNRNDPLLVGSVKSNTGHAEASAVFTSLAKVLIAMESGIIPANLNYESPNPNIESLTKGRIEVVSKNRKWNSGLAAINGIGLSSSYGHILLKANCKPKVEQLDNLPRLINISTRTEEGIQAILDSLKAEGEIDPEYAALIHDIFKKSIPGHLYRAYAILDGSEEDTKGFEYFPGNKRQVWFVYSGMGSQWCKMATDLMALPVFAEAIHKCHKVLESKGIDLLTIVTGNDPKVFENILHSFVGIAAVQIGLTDVLSSIGIVPDGIIGHSVGELGCAYADGCLSAEQMILCAYSRGRASLEANLIRGMMAAVGIGYSQIKDQCPPSIEVACHNSSDNSTISGPTEDMEVFVKDLQDKDVFARLVNVSNIAYHSKYIKPAGPLLLKYLQEVIPEPLPRSSKWISTSIPKDQWDTDLAKTSSAEYHTNNLLSPVLFEEGSKHIPKEAIVIEIAPHGLLQAILKRSLNINTTNIPLTLKTSKNGLHFLLSALGKLYLTGLDLDISVLYPNIRYPVGRGTKSLTPLVHWEHGESWRSGTEDKLHYLASVRDLSVSLNDEEYCALVGHQLQNTVVIPTSAYLAIVYEILNGIKQSRVDEVIFENLQFKNVIRVPKVGSASVYIMVQKGTGCFEISSGSDLIGFGRVRTPDGDKIFTDVTPIEILEDCLQLTNSDVYSEFCHRSHQYGGVYKVIKTLHLAKEGCVSTVKWDNNWHTFTEAMIQQCLFQKGKCNQNTLMVSSIQRIVISFSDLPTEPSDLKVTYNYATGVVSTTGIQIFGIHEKALEVLGEGNRLISYNAIDLKPLFNGAHQCIESGINLGLQITVENFQYKTFHNVMLVEIQTANKLLKNNIKNVINKNPHFNSTVATVEDSKEILISETEPVFVIINNVPDNDCINLVISSHVFLLAHTDSKTLENSEIAQVAEFTVDGVSYSLIRKSTDLEPLIVSVKTDTLNSDNLLCEDLLWTVQLKSAQASAKNQRVYLVSSVVPTDGVYNFFKNASTLPGMQSVRFLFILDKEAAESFKEESVYKKILKNDLNLIVLKNSCIGTYISEPTEFQNDVTNTSQSYFSNITGNTRIEYLGVNATDETLTSQSESKPELGNFDYSGITNSGQKRMGLARLDIKLYKLVLDPVLWWEVPRNWSLENAATVPYAYAFAYYSLIVVARAEPKEAVLVHGGCSAYGLAAIYVARKLGCSVYTTVTSVKQKAFMKKQFMFMNNHNIFSACETSFEPHILMATGGVGVQIVLNCLSGNMLKATYRCVAEFGKIVQVGRLDVEENTEIGMRIFLQNISLVTVVAEDIFNAPVDVKQKIQELVTEGLKSFTVRPVFRTVVHHQNIKLILSTLKQPEYIGKMIIKLSDNLSFSQLNIKEASQFICDPNTVYLIYGGTAEMWVDIVGWLIFRGARKLAISFDSESQQTYISRRLQLYQTYYDLGIFFTSTKAHTKDGAFELLSEICSLGPIGAIFILPNKIPEIKTVHYIDLALRTKAPKALFINFLNNATGVCHWRSEAGFITENIQWEQGLAFSDVLYALDNALTFKFKDILIKDEHHKENIQETVQSLYKKLNLLLPSSIDNLKEETRNAPIRPDFISLPSLCAQVTREIPPVFVIPGMFNMHGVEDLAKKLMYPVFCVNFPKRVLPLKTMAALLAKKMRDIYPRGPYNIIGVSFGGALAIEIAKILEQRHCKTVLQFIDGAPDTIQGVLRHLGDGCNMEIGYLCRILNLTKPEIIKGLTNLSNWETRLSFALKHYKSSQEEETFLREVLTTLKKYFDEIYNFQPSNDLVTGKVCLLRPTGANKYDVCGLQKYCKEVAQVNVIEGSHNSILKKKLTANLINNKIMC